MSGKKIVIIGEMNCDLFYKNEFFKELEERIAEKISKELEQVNNKTELDARKIIHDVIASLPKKVPGEAFIKRGGNGNNSTELLVILGVPTKFITVTGTGSEWMKGELEKLGVDTSCVFQLPKTQPVSTIIEDPTTTKIFTAANLKKEMNFSTIKLQKSHLADSTIVFLTPMGPKFEPVLSTVQSMNMSITTAITVEIQAIDTLETLKNAVKLKVDIIFINKADALKITGEDGIENADKTLSRFARIRFITRGAEGSLICSDFCPPVVLPVFPVKVIDRTGAGDAFAAGVLVKCHELVETGGAIINQLERATQKENQSILRELGVFGTAAASLKVSLARTPTRDEITKFLSKHATL